MARDFIAVPEYRKDLAASHIGLGQVLRKLDKPMEAEDAYRKAQSVLVALAAEFPTVASYSNSAASSHNNLANLLADGNKLEDALEQYRQAAKIRERLVADYPAIPEYKVDLAGVYANTAMKLFEGDRPTESLPWFKKAVDLLEPVHASAATSNRTTRYLQESYEGRSKALDKLERYAEGETDWDRYVALDSPDDKYKLLTKRWKRLLRQGMVNEAIEQIAEFTKLPDQDAELWYEFACVYSLAADRLPEKQVEYADRSMELLKQAVKIGYDNAKRMRADSDLEQLRDRDDFKTLIAEVESRATPKEPPSPLPESDD